MRQKSAICTPKRDDEHTLHCYIWSFPWGRNQEYLIGSNKLSQNVLLFSFDLIGPGCSSHAINFQINLGFWETAHLPLP